MIEIRKDVLWYEGLYQISNLWKVRSLFFRKENKVKELKLQKDKDGYNTVWLYKDGKFSSKRVARRVAIMFIDNPKNLLQVNHKDWDRLNNCVTNLERCSPWDNQKHSYRVLHRKKLLWNNNPFSKKTFQYNKQWNLIKVRDCVMDIERELWIKSQNISKVCVWSHYTAGWFIRKH